MFARRLLPLVFAAALGAAPAGPIDELARQGWKWRATLQPSSGDDVRMNDNVAAASTGWRH